LKRSQHLDEISLGTVSPPDFVEFYGELRGLAQFRSQPADGPYDSSSLVISRVPCDVFRRYWQ
jgi:hypothetical protein